MASSRVLAVLLAATACGRSLPIEAPGVSGAGSFVAVGSEGGILRSLDGRAWAAQSSPANKYLASIAAGRSLFVAVGGAGTIVTSADGLSWVARASGTAADLSHVIFTGQKFLAVGGSWDTGAALVESADGVSWIAVTSPSSYMFRAVAHGAGTVVAAANYKSDLQTPALFTTSLSQGSAAGTWAKREGPAFSDSVTVGDRIAVVGNGTVSSSTDGVTWSTQKAGADRGIAWSGALFVIVGEGGAISTSTDGTRWTAAEKTGGWLAGVTWGAPGFVAVGGAGAIVTSADGATWSQVSPAPTRLHLADVAYGP